MMPSKRRALACTLAVLACLQAACTTPVRPDHLAQQDRSSLGRIAVVGARFEPEYHYEAEVTGIGTSIARGALEGARLCTFLFGNNQLGAAFFLACAPFLVPIGALSAAETAVTAVTPEQIEAAKANAQRGIAALKLQESMVETVLRYGREMGVDLGRVPYELGPARLDASVSYARVRDAADSVIEVSVLAVKSKSFITVRHELHVALGMQARVRVLSTHDGKEIDTFTLRCDDSAARTPDEWLADQSRLIKAAFGRCAAWIAEQALDEVVFVYHPQQIRREAPSTEAQWVPPYTLRPTEPPLRYLTSSDRLLFERATLLSSQQPEFRWEPWPRGFTIVPGGESGQAREVRYDFRILRAGRVVYERRGLTAPAHRLEKPLRVCSTFRWTVRARFRLDDALRVTEWAGAYDTVGGIAPWRFRRDSDEAAQAERSSGPERFYAPVETPGALNRKRCSYMDSDL